MVRRKVQVGESKRAPPKPTASVAVAGKKKAPDTVKKAPGAVKKAVKETDKARRARAGLEISPDRCSSVLHNAWRGGKIAKEASVLVAACLQMFCDDLVTVTHSRQARRHEELTRR